MYRDIPLGLDIMDGSVKSLEVRNVNVSRCCNKNSPLIFVFTS
jgi:hypothetical protein